MSNTWPLNVHKAPALTALRHSFAFVQMLQSALALEPPVPLVLGLTPVAPMVLGAPPVESLGRR